MKAVIGIVGVVLGVMFSLSLVFANPAMLPKHEGYPMKNDGSHPLRGFPDAPPLCRVSPCKMPAPRGIPRKTVR